MDLLMVKIKELRKLPFQANPDEIFSICEALLIRLEIAEQRVSSLTDAQIRLDSRLHALERLASSYQEPRG